MSSEQLRREHGEFLFPCVATYYDEPIVLTEAQGLSVRDADGHEYLDMFGGILTVSLAHCEPRVADAVAQQMRRLGHTSTLYPTENLVKVAKRLARLTPGELKQCFFTNSGTEANETAVLLARMYTQRQEIVALRHGYSGRSMTAMSLTGHGTWRLVPQTDAAIKHAANAYCYRCPYGLSYPACDVRCAQDVEQVIQTSTTQEPAAFLAEPVQGVGGFIVPPKEYFEIAVGIVRNYGGIFICDEVQTGFGRTGEHWCGIEHFGVEPDVMTFAKGIANGMPVGATIAKPEMAAAVRGLSISTFGGNSVCMAGADATLDVMEDERMPTRAHEHGRVLRDGLEALQRSFPIIGDVRGLGLMQALELVEDPKSKTPAAEKTKAVMESAKRHGVLLGKGGLYGNVLRIAPPMLCSESELREALTRLERAFAEVRDA